ncbi:conjugal transfer protein TraO [Chryseobacterium balustinum]|uniref:Conjugative transposon protein TraO n=1 Tax=Chryseobacterium balustinum TaxID=246 RepID=A0AAX2INK5_9FLAO|nr:conjugal transfer protein TraO [Chryseobacterium balustinum]AZB30310.1 conjugal transfer protein TraO [Chryseobacterium balustinum]SKC02988.1 Conjugative transposon protein TraO [Chryseobacterium balustinum]SQA90949.1 Conjugative transposon protein TraO [Chryseobacterium balustinum]
MKRLHFYVISLFLMSLTAKAQRLIPTQKAIELNAGFLLNDSKSENYFLNTTITNQSGKGNYSFFSFEYQNEKHNYKTVLIPIETFLAEAGYSFNLISDRKKNLLFNFSLSATAGFESINKGNNLLFDGAEILSESNFVYGAGGTVSIEIYLSDRIVLLPHVKAKALWNSSRELIRPSAGLGIRINL